MPDIQVRTGPFDDQPPLLVPTGQDDVWSAFPDAPPLQANQGTGVNPFVAFPIAPSRFGTDGNTGDPWAAFPDWPPTQAQPGSADPFAAFPDVPPRSAAFQSWPEATINPANAMPFNPVQASIGNAFWQTDITGSNPAVYSQTLQAPPPAPVAGSPEPAPFDGLQMLRGEALQRSAAPPAQPNQGVPVQLSNGQNVPDLKSPTGYLMSPVADLGPVAAAGRRAGETYRSLLSNPETAPSALLYLGASLYANFHHGGIFDYQRQGNWLTGFTQLPQFYHVSNVNVGLFAQQAGLTLDETLSIAGLYARLFSKNADPKDQYGLNSRTRKFIETGFNIGERGVFGQPPAR